ncbi:putative periplasmic lipoprotein [Pedobacter puniceum]|uniref:Lipocalin-like domain-containing protein n=1 Tax=Pedobacter puniceum TaxID=2666136 RepID=A0A7K0FK98_9SPHI|nr:hypothetical protein [Pedobacter puniceum]MRX45845.1 hypothetical protein [Pedobacter puniceum]
MKKLMLLFIIITGLSACSDKLVVENNSLIGDWNLTSIYADPGDGSGKWNDVMITVIQRISFKADGKFEKETINGFDYVSYQLKDKEKITFKSASGEEITMRFALEGDVLTITPQCIEGCGFKFRKMRK